MCVADRGQRRDANALRLVGLRGATADENAIDHGRAIRQSLFQPRRRLIPDFLGQRNNAFKGFEGQKPLRNQRS